MEARGNQDFAPQACSACKKRKGKCDKIIPSCSFCTSKGLPCFYAPPGGSVQGILISQVEFPAVFYLDHEVFERSSLAFPPASSQVPSYVMNELGNYSQMGLVATDYFSTVHQWMPIVSKQLFHDHHLNSLNPFRADAALLCLSMKLITWLPSPENPDPITQTYLVARQFLDSWDMSVTLTLTALQGSILIALYEIGHAIYPAAYMSIGTCAQYAISLGLGWNKPSWNIGVLSWVEVEERRRVWWAIVILERYLALGWPQHYRISEAPNDNDLLPVDDFAWDEGIVTQSYPITASTPGDINMGRFARLAQATHLIDRVLKHNQDSMMTTEYRNHEATILDKALHSLISFTMEEAGRRQIKLCCQTALCHCALFLLHAPYINGPSGPRYELAKKALDQSCSIITITSERFINGHALPLNQISPIAFHLNYQAAVHFARLKREDPTTDAALALEKVQNSMRVAHSRWKLAGAYLSTLEVRQNMSQI